MKWAAAVCLAVCLVSAILAAGAWGWYHHGHGQDHALGSWFAFLAAGLALVAGSAFYIAARVDELEKTHRP